MFPAAFVCRIQSVYPAVCVSCMNRCAGNLRFAFYIPFCDVPDTAVLIFGYTPLHDPCQQIPGRQYPLDGFVVGNLQRRTVKGSGNLSFCLQADPLLSVYIASSIVYHTTVRFAREIKTFVRTSRNAGYPDFINLCRFPTFAFPKRLTLPGRGDRI